MIRKVLALVILTVIAVNAYSQNMFGAFQIRTEPEGAVVTLYGSNQYLGTTPTQVFPIIMDQYMVYYYGVPGRAYSLLISKEGYIPIKEDIFVPYHKAHEVDAVREPTVFHFLLHRAQVIPPYPPFTPPMPPNQNITAVRITTDPPDCALFINGVYIGRSPLIYNAWWGGGNKRFTVTAEKPRYRTARESFNRNDKRVHLVLKKAGKQ